MFYLAIGAILQTASLSSITDSIVDYKQFCQSAAESDELYAEFRRQDIYQEVVEMKPPQLGGLFAQKIIEQYPFLLPTISTLRNNDLYGAPLTYDYPVVGSFSPCTLRYISVAGDILTTFILAKPCHIVEIGVGYGGQCSILNALLPIERYTLIDLPSVLPLAKRYLGSMGVANGEFLTPQEVSAGGRYDLFISNYAFSECSRGMQLEYFDKVMKFCSNGYMIFNDISHDWDIDSLSLREIVELLELSGFAVTFQREEPNTHYGNYLITWTSHEA